MTDKQSKADTFIWTLIITNIMSLALCGIWEWLEKVIYGVIENRTVDNIIMVPVIISFWFNAKHFVEYIKSDDREDKKE